MQNDRGSTATPDEPSKGIKRRHGGNQEAFNICLITDKITSVLNKINQCRTLKKFELDDADLASMVITSAVVQQIHKSEYGTTPQRPDSATQILVLHGPKIIAEIYCSKGDFAEFVQSMHVVSGLTCPGCVLFRQT